MKNVVLIVDPFSTGCAYANEFRNRGYESICLISSKNLPERMKGQIDKNNYLAVFEDEEKCLEFIKNYTLKAVVQGSEVGVETAERLASKMGVLGNDITIPDLRRNKFKMHEKLKEQGLNYIPSYLVSANNIPSIPESKTGYVLKPCKSAASDGVIFIQTKEDLLQKLKSLNFESNNLYGDKNSEYIAEPFIEGTEFVVDLVAFEDGSIKVTSVCEYEKTEANDSKFVYKSLKVLNPKDYKTLTEYAIEASKALGFKVGPIHMEIKNKDNPVMIEVGARLHGGVAPSLFEYCYKPPLLEMSVKSYLGLECEEASLKEEGRIVFLISEKEGVFYPNFEELKKLSSYKGNANFIKEGELLKKTIDLNTCPGIFWLSNQDSVKLEEDALVIEEASSF